VLLRPPRALGLLRRRRAVASRPRGAGQAPGKHR
jgi:hypothetical protein